MRAKTNVKSSMITFKDCNQARDKGTDDSRHQYTQDIIPRSMSSFKGSDHQRHLQRNPHDTTGSHVSILSTHPHTSRRLYHLDQPQTATRERRRTISRWAADAGYRLNRATAGDKHHPMSQYTISPSRAVTCDITNSNEPSVIKRNT